MDDDQIVEVFDEPEEPSRPEELDAPEPARRGWLMTALLGALMLAIGLFLGYVGRGEFGPEAQAAKATQAAAALLQQTQAVAAQTQAAGNAEMMKYLTENTRHFKGEASAPVTIIEFSDFQ